MRNNTLWYIVLISLTAGLGSLAVGNFSLPLSNGNDTDQFEYVGYFFGKNLTLWPFPHLNLFNNQSFYPYGINQVFLDWGFERDYWYSLCYRLFDGAGPYLQFYYVYSLLVAAVGTFTLIVPRFGQPKALMLSLIVSVFNFYALWKFPEHMNICVDHWTVLCMVATYRILLDVVDRKTISLSQWLVWIWLHFEVLGQELGYVAGFALTLTTLTVPVLAVLLVQRFPVPGRWPILIRDYVRDQWGRQAGLIIGCILLIVLSAWLYLPLTLQVALTAWQFDFGIVPELRAWSHPLRLLIPHLPGIHSYALPYQQWLKDSFESYGQGSPGLYLVMLAGVGWWQIRRRVALWLPLVTMLVLCLLYHPVLLPTLKVFPWFSFNRHGGRSSLIIPVLLGLLALSVAWPRKLLGQIGLVVLLGLLGAEWYTGYRMRLFIPVDLASQSLLRYCAVVKQQPGVAVLDWPFCTIGADGVGAKEGLCPYYDRQNAVFTFRRFYDKRAVGQYFGRLHPDQIRPFLRDGWPRLLTPGYAFTAQDWQFLDSFLHTNKFAGINLYPDLLTPPQVAQFYQRYGRPIAETRFPAAGRVVFIPIHRKR
ncbi:hypothetical protein [Spirosoma agri]|uniref:Glycosyltransferase RgtA/B/C/D-like domain-containing protein n=1 Tax=Spirosoma agri TaxID=1987381 RepID=A0A6M0IGG4_9BACT|nr:hypothetical protein [Spirosoma agri]NEU67376.1 hypothetical protein [Spirosoma agri]